MGKNNGFIFLEVMLAVTFFSISIIYIFAGFSRSVLLTQKSINQWVAIGVLEEKINGLNGSKSGYSWQMDSLEKRPNLDEITCTVSWGEGKNRGSVTAVTYLRKNNQ